MALAEPAVEVGEIGEAGGEGDPGNTLVRLDQLGAGVADAHVVDEIEKTPAGGTLEEAAERGGRERGGSGGLVEPDPVVEMIEYIPARAVDAVAAGEIGGLEPFAAQEPRLPGLGERREDGDEFGDTRRPDASVKLIHPSGDSGAHFAGELDAAVGAQEELADGTKFGMQEEIPAEAVLAELDDQRVGVLPGAAPVMRQVGADKHEVTRTEGGDVVADEAQAVAGDDEGEFVFGMNVPRRGEPGQAELAHDEGGVGAGGYQFVFRLTGLGHVVSGKIVSELVNQENRNRHGSW